MDTATVINPDDIERFEVTEICAPDNPEADIVLVHGLNGHPRKTWTAKNGVFWPLDLLPRTLKSARARILVYGYNADVYAFGSHKSASSDMIHQHAQTLVQNLATERRASEMMDRPIIFVCHSLGGILVKRALEYSNDLTSRNADDSRSIFVSTYGIIFLGTPHNGADAAAKWGHILQSMADTVLPKKLIDTEPQLINALKGDSETLQNINLHFLDIYQRFQIAMVHEAAKTDVKGTMMYIVDEASAAPKLPDVTYYGIEATHSGMCKFSSLTAPGYRNVSVTIKRWVQEARPVVETRWLVENRARQAAREAHAREVRGEYYYPQPAATHAVAPPSSDLSNSVELSTSLIIHSNTSIEPERPGPKYFVRPEGFRPNAFFVGRQRELQTMHDLLFHPARRARGTSAVLVRGVPGGGKTHFVRQYVYDHLDAFPGGIFWVRAKDPGQLTLGFWEIACAIDVNPAVTSTNTNTAAAGASAPPDPDSFVAAVRTWFMNRRQWLLVLDGVYFSHVENNGLPRFIPDNIDCSLIYTSVSPIAEGNFRFLNPKMIELPLLSALEARELFLCEIGRRRTTDEELALLNELVRRMDGLPVVVHAVARRLKATNEPLAKLVRSYLQAPKLRGLEPFREVRAHLKVIAHEALNLINILSFFSQHIPVEMITMGMKALDIPIKVQEQYIGQSLNNTFVILNNFALIERNVVEARGSLHSSRSSKSSKDMIAESVDVIRLHSVVQDYFVDALRLTKEHDLWLERVVRLYCCSFDTADEKIKEKTPDGLAKDYRLYQIHGKVILSHIPIGVRRPLRMEWAVKELRSRLDEIQRQISRRTSGIASSSDDGQPLVSVFNRSSSSSDIEPETPAFEGIADYIRLTESPTNLHNGPISTLSGLIPAENRTKIIENSPMDAGYEGDLDEATSTVKHRSPVTVVALTEDQLYSEWYLPGSDELLWDGEPLPTHRTIQDLRKNRYRDSAGSWRAVVPDVSDPRVKRRVAQGFLEPIDIQSSAIAPVIGPSAAVKALTTINASSPKNTPATLQSPVRPASRPYPADSVIRAPPYPLDGQVTANESSSSPVNIRQRIADTMSSVASFLSISPREKYPPSPVNDSAHPPPLLIPDPGTFYDGPIPLTEETNNHLSGFNPNAPEFLPESYMPSPRLEDSHLTYPPREEHIPIEMFGSATLPPRREYDEDYSNWGTRVYPTTADVGQPQLVAYPVRPQIPVNYESQFVYPTLPSGVSTRFGSGYLAHDGYTSQPMSRNRSKASNASSYADLRPASPTKTEPLPQLPVFPPRERVLTSYQLYNAMAPDGRLVTVDPSLVNSPTIAVPVESTAGLSYEQAAKIKSVDEWTEAEQYIALPIRRSPLNPNVAPFYPPTHPLFGANIPQPALVAAVGPPITFQPLRTAGAAVPVLPSVTGFQVPRASTLQAMSSPASTSSSPIPSSSPLAATPPLRSTASSPRGTSHGLPPLSPASPFSPPPNTLASVPPSSALSASPLASSVSSITSPGATSAARIISPNTVATGPTPPDPESTPHSSTSGGVYLDNTLIEFGGVPDKRGNRLRRSRASRTSNSSAGSRASSRGRGRSTSSPPYPVNTDGTSLTGLGIGNI